ncbi:DUF6236 family protein [Streptomyces sp. T-3]|nr:DUF6236 family protein [Streptomyces sp. T-3]
MAVLLYYPRTVPPKEVVHQSLLYWDGIASVVPLHPRGLLGILPRELLSLQDEGLYFPCRPEWWTDDYGVGSDGRIGSLHEVRYLEERLAQALSRLPRSQIPGALGTQGTTHLTLHQGKAPGRIMALLVELGLGRWMPEQQDGVLAVTTEAHRLVMATAVLALVQPGARLRIGSDFVRGDRVGYERNESVALSPYTDDEAAYQWAHSTIPPVTRSYGWQMEIGQLLPVPAPETPTQAVVAFRKRHSDERERLMRALHRLLGDLRRDYEHPADVFAQLRREIQEAEGDYRRAAKAARLVWVSRSIQVTVALGAAAAGGMLVPDVGWLLGTVSGYALNIATRETRTISRAPGVHDFSYLHEVRTQLPATSP